MKEAAGPLTRFTHTPPGEKDREQVFETLLKEVGYTRLERGAGEKAKPSPVEATKEPRPVSKEDKGEEEGKEGVDVARGPLVSREILRAGAPPVPLSANGFWRLHDDTRAMEAPRPQHTRGEDHLPSHPSPPCKGSARGSSRGEGASTHRSGYTEGSGYTGGSSSSGSGALQWRPNGRRPISPPEEQEGKTVSTAEKKVRSYRHRGRQRRYEGKADHWIQVVRGGWRSNHVCPLPVLNLTGAANPSGVAVWT